MLALSQTLNVRSVEICFLPHSHFGFASKHYRDIVVSESITCATGRQVAFSFMPPILANDDALHNRLLAALPEAEFTKIRPSLAEVELDGGQVLWEADGKENAIYFPVSALILLLYETEKGVSLEVGLTGRNGIVGVSTFMGNTSTPTRAVVYSPGKAYKMTAAVAKDEFKQCGDFQDMCLSFAQALIAQITQSAVCNRLHSVDQQVCRLLLRIHDHQGDDTILLTHEQIAQALGVRRETISLAASMLKENGLIKYSRGKIKILDRDALEGFACECYSIETDQYRKLLSKYVRTHG